MLRNVSIFVNFFIDYFFPRLFVFCLMDIHSGINLLRLI